jgi:hypothetical protein
MKKLLLVTAIFTLSSCSIYKAASQAGPADLAGIGVGTPRNELISRLGAPKIATTTATGDVQDYFEFKSGMHPAAKLRILPYLAADVFTAGLAEIVLWPLEESIMDSATCTGIATYDVRQNVNSWSMSSKKDSSAQDC